MGTVGKALRLLELLSSYDAPVRLSELSRDAGMNKSTVYRMLESLRNHGYIQQDEPNGRYMMTTKMWQIGIRAFQRQDIRTTAKPYLDALARETDEPAVLAILEGLEVVIIDRSASSQAVQTVSMIGSRTPIHCSSLGKAFMMGLQDEGLQYLKLPLRQFTPKTITRIADLRENVKQAVAAGIATGFDEFDNGVSGVAAPVMGGDNKVHCAIGITLPSVRAEGPSFERCKDAVREQARLLSAQLGYDFRQAG